MVIKKYKQLNYEDRIAIRYGLFKNMSIREISHMLGRSPSTISKEIKRGITVDEIYFAESTERELRRKKLNNKRRRIIDNSVSSIVIVLSEYNILHIHSITYDNGCEFAGHEDVNKVLQCQSYFCNAYHSWEKGMIENINGLIRRFLPKGTNFDNITDKQIKRIENWINNKNMKILGWKSLNQIFKSVAL